MRGNLNNPTPAGADHGCCIAVAVDSLIAAAGNLVIPFGTERWDTDAFHDPGANTRITIPAGLGGRYLVTGNLFLYDNDPVDYVLVTADLRLDGTRVRRFSLGADGMTQLGAQISIPFSYVLPIAAGQYLDLLVSNISTGGTIVLSVTNNEESFLQVQKIDKAG